MIECVFVCIATVASVETYLQLLSFVSWLSRCAIHRCCPFNDSPSNKEQTWRRPTGRRRRRLQASLQDDGGGGTAAEDVSAS